MKLLILGNCLFSKSYNAKICNPFEALKQILRSVDVILLNMDSLVTDSVLRDRYKDCRTDGIQLLSLKKLVPQTPIIVNFQGENVLACGLQGIRDTKNFLTRNEFIFSTNNIRPLLYGTLCIFKFIDVGIMSELGVMYHSTPIDIENSRRIELITRIIKTYKKPLRTIIIMIRWNSTRLSLEAKTDFAKKLIDNGVKIVIGYGNHNVSRNTYKYYRNGAIIFNLGDSVQSQSYPERIYLSLGEICIFNTVSSTIEPVSFSREAVDDCVIPYKVLKIA